MKDICRWPAHRLPETDFTVATIFVNPAQFAAHEDLDNYPRQMESDCALLEAIGCDLVFAPKNADIYPDDFNTWVIPKGPEATEVLCGFYRPQFFPGILTVVAKLFNLARPDVAYFGQKDYQQAWLIKRMVADLNFGFEIRVMPIVREADGLAMSSRNQYLTAEERPVARVLSTALQAGQSLIEAGNRDPQRIKSAMLEILQTEPLYKGQYVEILDAETMLIIDPHLENTAASWLIAAAGYVGETRLIDNLLITVPALAKSTQSAETKGAVDVS